MEGLWSFAVAENINQKNILDVSTPALPKKNWCSFNTTTKKKILDPWNWRARAV